MFEASSITLISLYKLNDCLRMTYAPIPVTTKKGLSSKWEYKCFPQMKSSIRAMTKHSSTTSHCEMACVYKMKWRSFLWSFIKRRWISATTTNRMNISQYVALDASKWKGTNFLGIVTASMLLWKGKWGNMLPRKLIRYIFDTWRVV